MRTRVDGNKFQNEFSKSISESFYVLRLPTLNTGYSGLTQPADFIVFGKVPAFVETKETGNDAFSISQMEQLEAMKDFEKHRTMYRTMNLNYYVVVHFIKRHTLKVIAAEEALDLYHRRKQLHYNDAIGLQYTTLDELREGGIFNNGCKKRQKHKDADNV